MKRLIVLGTLVLMGSLSRGALLETTSEAERFIDQHYTTERSRRLALKKLDAILDDAKLSDADKEARVRAAFLVVRSPAANAGDAGDRLLYTAVLTWRVHSLAVAHDLDGRYESIVSRERLAEAKSSQSAEASSERRRADGQASAAEKSGALNAEAGLVFGIIPKLAANAEGRTAKTSSSTSSSGSASAWTRQDQAALNNRYESVMKELSATKLSGLHIRFVVEFTNHSDRDMVVPEGSVIPVYAGSASFSVMAKMESSVALNIPARGTVDIAFRGDLATTAARELVDFMRTRAPVIAPEKSPLLVIRSTDGAVRNAVNESARVACARIVCGAYAWNVRRTLDGRPVTIRQALEAVNSRYDVPPFAWEGNRLKTVCGAVCGAFDLERVPCVETDAGISIGWDDILEPLPDGDLRFGVMKAKVFVQARNRRWDDLTPESRQKLVARLSELDRDRTAQCLLGMCYERGLGFEKSDAEAVKWYRKSAEQGYAIAQNNLGYMYSDGRGVEQSEAEAVKWYRKAAEQGHVYAQYNLGTCYDEGRGVKQSDAEAVKWYRKSAEQGDADAQNNLGVMYESGRGVEQSNVEAVKWYRKSAEQGDATAQCNLGVMYENGRGVEQSEAEAVKWYRKSAEQGYACAQCNLGVMYENGRGVEQSEAEAVKWYRKSAEQGYACAQCNLGLMYEKGRGVEQSDMEAVKWYRKSAEQGYARAQCYLGEMYYDGRGVEKSDMEAVKWARKSAEQGYARAQCHLGFMYEEGRGVEQSDMEAVKWYRKSAEQGHATAQCNLGWMYESGRGVEQSNVEAVKWYRKAAEQGHATAQCNLGWMYENGRGVEQSNVEAAKWYRKAAEQGNSRAQYNLGEMYYYGRGVEQSDVEAAKWYHKSAEQGYINAQNDLGWMYRNGRGVEQSDMEAVKWYRKSAEQGHATAQKNLAWMYREGRGVERSNAEAIKWYRKAEQNGCKLSDNERNFMNGVTR